MVPLLKECEFTNPETDEVNRILNDTIKDIRKNDFHSFEIRCVNDIKFLNMENNGDFF